jgi:hypothetical protein
MVEGTDPMAVVLVSQFKDDDSGGCGNDGQALGGSSTLLPSLISNDSGW